MVEQDSFEELVRESAEVHCVSCGRFLGFQNIKEGYFIAYCNKCKTFTVFLKDGIKAIDRKEKK